MKIPETVRNNFMSTIRAHLEEDGEEVLQTKSGTLCVPWSYEEEEGYLTITFSIPKGTRDGTLYDGYEEAENYRIESEVKAEAKRKREEVKQKKIARAEQKREEAKRKREEREAKETE